MLQGKKVAIIGGTGGLGRALAKLLAASGAEVTVVGQTHRDTDAAGIRFLRADLSRMQEALRVAALLPAEQLDVVVFTTGIFAAPQRQETSEGLERDMAVSFLSRLVILREIAPTLGAGRPAGQPRPRVFVMGYPGAGQTGKLGDLNAERSYGAMAVHMNTVAGNEMLVLDAARRYSHVGTFGLNPGLVKTDIRSNYLGGRKLLSSLVEGLIGLLTPSAEAYARRIAPLLFAPELEARSGAFFDNKARAILPSAGLTPEHTSAFLAESDALVQRALISKSA
ncbi:MAG: SDR family NAD(P)-dependent oxidoreductase [Burkholderiaceae bacterium]|nr:SDR family NAD(P)-dependent oxidoreductase [Burkholderiaceae bacterium]